ncbi:peptidoglycan D,D-transpeptidase FtsI family protein [Chitinimonas sp. BJB300]|uniref:peptidoglycan D,D-transpeptidase FtsI family protein n=1 Tax=Chitinimonas sp. BJB300 TaxID=1559339 RepID=UPI000C0E332B|nr:penicillin-binding protein 2 [Chitinimonas sp. BJB300]PHV12768.1 cell division protein [Chitinimonas sp. BJB300]TSJ91362.1 penicillin-binding protein 2 [Chitinimonas sp. BJB300]
MTTYRTSPNPVLKLQMWRAWLVLAGLLILFSVLIGRATYLMTFKEEFLREQGEARYFRKLTLEANRGMITDRNGEPLAISTPVQSIWASPSGMPPMSHQQLIALSKALGMSPEDIKAKLANKKRDFVFLKRQMSPEAAARVIGLAIPGVSKQNEYRRYYPAGEVMAHIIGFTDIDNKGQEGFELTRESMLAGKAGSRQVIRDRRGYIVEDVTSIEKPRDGQTLTLSIDRKIQYLAFRELKNAVEVNQAKGGGIVVLDAQTGEVLALANYPSYNPNNRVNYDPAARRNRAITDLYEPGSTMKPLSISAALESGKFKPETVMSTNNGTLTIGPATIRDVHSYGPLSLANIIKKSSNVGTAKVALELSREYLWNFYDSVGVGEAPRSGFPGEASGRLRPWKTWRPIEQATMSYGYGLSVSLLQMAKAYQAFATDGEIRPVTFQKLVAPLPGKRVMSAQTAEEVRNMLETVTQPGGTALRAQVVGYRVGGKTGTSKKLAGGSYVGTKAYVGSFVGIAPISNPRLVVAVMIDEPGGASIYGGTVAAPTFSSVVAGSLRMLGVPPDAPLNNILLPDPAEPEVKEET